MPAVVFLGRDKKRKYSHGEHGEVKLYVSVRDAVALISFTSAHEPVVGRTRWPSTQDRCYSQVTALPRFYRVARGGEVSLPSYEFTSLGLNLDPDSLRAVYSVVHPHLRTGREMGTCMGKA